MAKILTSLANAARCTILIAMGKFFLSLVTYLESNMDDKSRLLAGIIAGLTAPASLFSTSKYPHLQAGDNERLRGDVKRVGVDFSTVIAREHGKKSRGK